MTDEQIINLYWERSESAIQETEKAYGSYFHAIAYRILYNEEDAKEIVNDTYLKAWNVIPPARPNPLKTFLGRITRQLSINRLEKNTAGKRGSGQYTAALEELAECTADRRASDPEERIALRDALNSFLWSQPVQARKIFVRRYWYMCSVAEIAEAFALGESKVKMQLLRTRRKLREHLEKEGFVV